MDAIIAKFFITVIAILVGIGIAHIVIDHRSFAEIKMQCEKQGFIQDKTTRIKCEVEK